MSFPPGFVERVRDFFPLSQVVGRRVALKRHGREHMGLCPFHKEKTPSFTVSDEKGFYHCFGCGAHGDAITFLREQDGLGYREAVERLAVDAGIPVPEFRPEHREQQQRQTTLHDVVETAAQWFEQQLRGNAKARDYLAQRGLNDETLKTFRVGYAPAGRDELKKHLSSKGISEQLMIDAGLVAKREDGSPYDRFRERVMFPIRDARGKVVAFGGRLMPDANVGMGHAPKYLNSPEMELFKKGEMLYNLDLAAPASRDRNVILVAEGYMDTVALSQGGFPHSVATLGTAVTEHHLKKLWSLVPEPVLCLDGDNAGKRAMLRAAELALPLLQPGFSLRFAMLPAGEDPDTLIKQHGASAMQQCVERATPLAETLWQEMSGHYLKQKTPDARAALEDHLMRMAERIEQPVVRNHYRAYFRDRLWQHGKISSAPAMQRHAQVTLLAGSDEIGRAYATCLRQMLKLLLLCPHLLKESEVEESLAHMACHDAALGQLRDCLLEAAHEETDLMERLAAQGLTPQVEGLKGDAALPVPKHVINEEVDALRFARDLIRSYRVLELKADVDRATQQLEADQTDAHLERLNSLREALKQMESERRLADAS